GPGAELKAALDNKLPVPKPVTDTLNSKGPAYLVTFKDKMDLKDVAIAPLKPIFPPPLTGEVSKAPATGPSEEKVPLPTLMASVMTAPETSSGLSVAWVPDPNKPVDATAAATPVPEIGRVNQQAQPAEAPRT